MAGALMLQGVAAQHRGALSGAIRIKQKLGQRRHELRASAVGNGKPNLIRHARSSSDRRRRPLLVTRITRRPWKGVT